MYTILATVLVSGAVDTSAVETSDWVLFCSRMCLVLCLFHLRVHCLKPS